MSTPLTRPDGRIYRPRKGLRAHAWENANEDGAIVFGTLDPDEALPLAQQACDHWYGDPGYIACRPRPGWYRDGFEHGRRTWIEDERRGAPGVMFTYDERTPPAGEPS